MHTAIEHLVWAHKHGPEEARGLAMAYVVQHIKTIQVTEAGQPLHKRPVSLFSHMPCIICFVTVC